jgi:PAS domain S-box-containing protein
VGGSTGHETRFSALASAAPVGDLLEAAPDPIVITDSEGTIVLVNARVRDVLGYERSELIGQPVEILVPERFRGGHRGHRHEFLGQPTNRPMGTDLDLWARRRDGSEIPVEISLSPLDTDDGLFVSASIRDVTERHRVEQARRSLARHFELSHELVATCGFDGYFKQLNGAWEPTLGLAPAELLQNPFLEIVHPDDRDAVVAEVARLAKGETTAEFRLRAKTKGGGWRWTEWSAAPDVEAGLFYAAGRDVDDRVAAERQLERERRQLADAQQIAKVGSWERDSVHGERLWSAQQYRNHGFDPDGPLPTTEEVLERVHPEDRELLRSALVASDAEGGELWVAYRVVLPDGEVREIETVGRPFTDADGVTRMMGTSRDVTAERDAQRLKQEFFGLISHELRTPLTSIIGYTELLADVESDNLSEQGRRFLEVIERNSRRELDLVGDLLLLTRITAGTFEIEVGSADLATLAAATVEEARPAAEEAAIALALDAPERLAIRGDQHRLAQVADNLVSNAIKFTPEGGRVIVRVRPEGEAAVLEVADSGIGVSQHDRARLFERMFRAAEADRRQIPGTGLGLTIAKAIIDAHQGSISVASEPGEGATFRVRLPVAGPHTSGSAEDGDG